MKTALVIHPRFYVYGGGELLCLYVCKTLQEAGFQVSLACDVFDPRAVEQIYGMGRVMDACDHLQIPRFNPFLPRFMAYQRLNYAWRFRNYLADTHASVIFSTQSSIYFIPKKPMYHFIYDIVDLFAYPTAPMTPEIPGPSWSVYYAFLRWYRKRILEQGLTLPLVFFALSTQILNDLKAKGYNNSRLIYPPCPLRFSPRPKKQRVVQVTRLVPQKRLEWFMQIARNLPEYEFLIVGRDNPILQRFNPGYTEKLMMGKPDNVKYVESAIKQCPELLEESKVYLYTGIEPGIGIALVESIGAGCIPVAPAQGGGGEVIQASGAGYSYNTVGEATEMVRKALEAEEDPWALRKKAGIFSPESFQQQIGELL